MRILHTSDWHLGQHFMGKSRQTEHQALIDWQLSQVEVNAVDAVPLIATGRLTTVGASSNESVREIYIGSLETFPAAAFPPALMHQ